MKPWWKRKESGSLLGMKILFFTYRWLGRWVFVSLLWPVIVYFFVTGISARKASLAFLQQVDSAKALGVSSKMGMLRLSLKQFFTFGDLMLDKLAVWFGCLDVPVHTHGFDALKALIAEGTGGIIFVSHLGNTEISMALAERWGVAKVNAMVHTQHAEKFNAMLADVSGEHSVNLIQVQEINPATAMLLDEKLQRGEVVAIAADRTAVVDPSSGVKPRNIYANFLGKPAPFPMGPFVLSALLKRPVFFLCSVKSADRYDIYLEKFSDQIVMQRKAREASLQPYVQQYADRLGDFAQRYPLQWGNFYDFWQAEDIASR
ncbi:hypothetical protein QWY82_18525 [Simiduia curdlanivorans]|uniref:Acyltransferase n=1 Tax=Simiduia curdlanivorans TaxID=1492769 RepID=A0ABV8V549_9GAMM|nr:hypothetical protein [Simiduia curdlanivorans]MDN3640801.1 hypothetical protein [Simiduia curdlanivorans]